MNVYGRLVDALRRFAPPRRLARVEPTREFAPFRRGGREGADRRERGAHGGETRAASVGAGAWLGSEKCAGSTQRSAASRPAFLPAIRKASPRCAASGSSGGKFP